MEDQEAELPDSLAELAAHSCPYQQQRRRQTNHGYSNQPRQESSQDPRDQQWPEHEAHLARALLTTDPRDDGVQVNLPSYTMPSQHKTKMYTI